MDTGLIPEKYLDPHCEKFAINTSIFFLVEHKQIYYLMYYRCFPLPIDPKNVNDINKEKFEFKD